MLEYLQNLSKYFLTVYFLTINFLRIYSGTVRTILPPANKKTPSYSKHRIALKQKNTSFLHSSTSLFQYNASSLTILYCEYKLANCEKKPVHNVKLAHCIQWSIRSCADIYLHIAKCINYLGRGLLSPSNIYNKTHIQSDLDTSVKQISRNSYW